MLTKFISTLKNLFSGNSSKNKTTQIDSIVSNGDIVVGDVNINIESIIINSSDQKIKSLALKGDINKYNQITTYYLNYLYEKFMYISMRGLGIWSSPINLSLVDIYVPIRVTDTLPNQDDYSGHSIRQDLIKNIQIYDNMVLLGAPGSGKSTILKYLAINAILDNKPIGNIEKLLPVYIPIVQFADILENDAIGFKEFLMRFLNNISSDIWAVFETAIEKGNVLFLLDSLDEIKNDTTRNLVFERIVDYFTINKSKRNKVIISCRKLDYYTIHKSAPIFKEFELLPFDVHQIEQFLENWITAIKDVSGNTFLTNEGEKEIEELKQFVELQKDVEELIANPLILTILVIMKPDLDFLPQQKTQFYNSLITHWLQVWNRLRSNSTKSKLESHLNLQVQDILSYIAYQLNSKTSSSKNTVTSFELVNLLKEYFKSKKFSNADESAYKSFELITQGSFLLNQVGPDEFEFAHRTFQEVLAGIYLSINSKGDSKVFFESITPCFKNISYWRNSILAGISHMAYFQRLTERAEEIIKLISKSTNGNPGEASELAGQALIEVHPLLLREDEVVLKNLRHYMKDRDVKPNIRKNNGMHLADLNWLPDDIWEFREIPEGKFIFGSNGIEEIIGYNFWVSKYPITNLQFEEFFNTFYDDSIYWSQKGIKWYKGEKVKRKSHALPKYSNPLLPVTNVNYYEAEAFSSWVQKNKLKDLSINHKNNYTMRLLTEKEWERVARGYKGNKFPWGNDFHNGYANVLDVGLTKNNIGIGPTVVCQYPQGSAECGALDLCGNTWEWTLDMSQSSKNSVITKGGCWNSSPNEATTYQNFPFPSWKGMINVGFRIAYSVKDP